MEESSNQHDDEYHYDAILIGSGIGAMSTAVALSKRKGWRCLLLEQHTKIGGLTHEFTREGRYHFDVGVHYLGELAKGGLIRHTMDYVTGGKVDWQPMPDAFERFVYPDMMVEISNDPQGYLHTLQNAFPEESKALERYFKDVVWTASMAKICFLLELLPSLLQRLIRPLLNFLAPHINESTQAFAVYMYLYGVQEYLDHHFKDHKLKSILTSQWGDIGVPPSKSGWACHCLLVNHYLHGGYYPKGGAHTMAQAILPKIRAAGGTAKGGMLVQRILTNDSGDRVIGVRARRLPYHYNDDKEEEEGGGQSEELKDETPDRDLIVDYFAPVVISDVGAMATYSTLLPPQAKIRVRFHDELRKLPPSFTAVTLFLGLRDSPVKLGYHGANYWHFQGYDHDAVLAPGSDVGSLYFLAFPSLKDPSSHQPNTHTVQMIASVDRACFKEYEGTMWKDRGEGYKQLKTNICERLLDMLRKDHPDLVDLVDFYELATPLTYAHFLHSRGGGFYQLPAYSGKLDWPFAKCRSPIAGLFLTGTDTFAGGVVGAMMGGIKCYGVMNGLWDFLGLMKDIYAS